MTTLTTKSIKDMKTLKMPLQFGSNFHTVAENAQDLSTEKGVPVEFEFNGIQCVVTKETELSFLFRDYCKAHLMEWKTVGPICPEHHSPEISKELARREKEREERQAKEQAEYDAKCKAEQTAFEKKTAGVTIELSDPEGWNDWKTKNTDPYGACIFQYAENWAKLMQAEINKGKKLTQIAEPTSFELGFMGITGFMYGAAVQILAKCWKHGEALRKWHNKEYDHEGEGVVNPAILTVSLKD